MDEQTRMHLLKTMVRIRLAELQLAIMYKNGKVFCAAHLYEGEEAVAAGVCANLRSDDCITSTHRGHGHCIAKGMPMKEMIAEVCGRITGCCGGKGGTMHLFKPGIGVMGTVGIVGGGIPLATGLGLVVRQWPQLLLVVRYAGAAYLLWMAAAVMHTRRKTLANNLMRAFSMQRAQAVSCLQAAGLPEQIRGERLDVRDFVALSDVLTDWNDCQKK